MTSETAQMLAKGRKLELIDGTTVTIRYTAYALAIIEEEYGLDKINVAMGAKDAEVEEAVDKELKESLTKRGRMRLMGDFLALGVVDREITGDELLKLIPLENTQEATTILQEAMLEAFPKANREQRRAAEKAERAASASPGETSSTSGAPSSTNPEETSGS